MHFTFYYGFRTILPSFLLVFLLFFGPSVNEQMECEPYQLNLLIVFKWHQNARQFKNITEMQCFLLSPLWGNLLVLRDLQKIAGFHHYADNSVRKTQTIVIKRHKVKTEKSGHAHSRL